MGAQFDGSDFVDRDYEASRQSAAESAPEEEAPVRPAASPAPAARPPSLQEMDSQVSAAQQRLLRLKQEQEELQRERSSLEETRRKQIEFQTGREEILDQLTRGLGLLEEAEFTARRDAQQLTRSLADLKEALEKVEAIDERTWTRDTLGTELTKSLTAIENARMEWNAARLKWPVLNGQGLDGGADGVPESPLAPLLHPQNFKQLCRLGFAFTWPLFLLGFLILVVLLLKN